MSILSDAAGLPPAFLAFVLVVAFVGFVFSSTLGVGGALLLIPVLMTRMPPAQAVAISAPVMLFNNLLKTWVFRRHVHRRALLLVCVGALPAAAVGAAMAAFVDDRFILIGVALMILASLASQRLLRRPFRLDDRRLALWGVLTGAVSGLCGAAGPPSAVGLTGYGLDREAFVGTVAVFAVALQVVKLPGYMATGVLPAELWPLALMLSTTALLAVLVAPRLVAALKGGTFRLALDVFLAITAVWMLLEASLR